MFYFDKKNDSFHVEIRNNSQFQLNQDAPNENVCSNTELKKADIAPAYFAGAD